MPRAAAKPATTRRRPPENWESEARSTLVELIGGINTRLDKIDESLIALVRVEERHEALAKEVTRIATLVDGMEQRVDVLEKHRDVSIDNREAKRYWWVLIGGLITAVGGIALVAVEFWNGHQETIHAISEVPPIIVQQPANPQPPRVDYRPTQVEPPPKAAAPSQIKPAVNNPDR